MKKYLTTLLLLVAAFSFSQTASYQKIDGRKSTRLMGPVIMSNLTPMPRMGYVLIIDPTTHNVYRTTLASLKDSLIVNGLDTSHWTLSGPDITNNNAGKVTIYSGLYLPHLVPEARIGYLLGHETTTGNVFPVLLKSLHDSLAIVSPDSNTWIRDAVNGELYPAHISDKIAIGKNTATAMLDVFGNATTDDLLYVSNDLDATKDSSVVITKEGRVAIGTTNPGYKLVVGTTHKLNVVPDYGGQGEIRANSVLFTSSSGDLSFFPNTDAGTAGDMVMMGYYNGNVLSAVEIANVTSGYGNLLLMKSGGNVGINNIAPDSTLDVTGSGHFTTNLKVDGFINLVTTTAAAGQIKMGGVTVFHMFQHPTGGGAVPNGLNLFIGEGAGNFTTGSTATQDNQASENIGIGYDALHSNTTGYRNNAFGNYALTSNTTGYRNSAFGRSLVANISGYYNSAFGDALANNRDGDSCSAFGYTALNYNVTDANCAFGLGSLYFDSTGTQNTGMGVYSLYTNKFGHHNSAFGYRAGYLATGTGNLFIGYRAGSQQTTGDNKLYIDNSNTTTPLIGGDFATDNVKINGTLTLNGYTVATLPAGAIGMTAYVTDALTPTFLAIVIGGGAVVTPVFYNGTNWVGY